MRALLILFCGSISPYFLVYGSYFPITEEIEINENGNIALGVGNPGQANFNVEVAGALVVNNRGVTPPSAGMLEWDGSHFRGYTGSQWLNLDSSFDIDETNEGGVLFVDSFGNVDTNELFFFWDNQTKRLGIGTTTPSTALEVDGTITARSFSGAGTGLTGIAADLDIGGNAATATELASDPVACPDGMFVSDIAANGRLTCSQPDNGHGNSGSTVGPAIYQGVITNTQSLSNYSDIPIEFLSDTHIENSVYSHNTNNKQEEIKIQEAGTYRISYSIGWNNGSYGRLVIKTWLEKDNVEVIPSKSTLLTADMTGAIGNTSAGSFVVDVEKNDILEIHSDCEGGGGWWGGGCSGVNTIPNEGWILIEKIA